jgi:hypothetical protein
MGQLIQVTGSLLILAPFALTQAGRLPVRHPGILLANLAGSAALALDAAFTGQWGFLLLEGSWAAVSLYALITPDRSDDVRVRQGNKGPGEERRHPGDG